MSIRAGTKPVNREGPFKGVVSLNVRVDEHDTHRQRPRHKGHTGHTDTRITQTNLRRTSQEPSRPTNYAVTQTPHALTRRHARPRDEPGAHRTRGADLEPTEPRGRLRSRPPPANPTLEPPPATPPPRRQCILSLASATPLHVASTVILRSNLFLNERRSVSGAYF